MNRPTTPSSARPVTRPNTLGAPSSSSQAPASEHNHLSSIDLKAVQAQHQDLLRRHGRLELIEEQAAKTIKECEAKAQAMGIASLEDLRAKVEEDERLDREAQVKFLADLKSTEEHISRIEKALEDLEGA